MAAAQLSGRLTRRLSPVRVLAIGLAVNLLGALCLAATVLLGLGLPFVLGSLFVMVSAIGLVLPTSTALGLSNYPERAGTASALLGLLQYLVGGLAAPLVGLAGEDTAVPLGVVAGAASLGACLVFALLVVPPILARRRTRGAEPVGRAAADPGLIASGTVLG